MSNQPNGIVSTYDYGQVKETCPKRSWLPGLDPRIAFTGLFVCLGYYLGARLGMALTFEPHPVAVMWPPNAILLAALLLTPSRWWWFLVLVTLPAHLASEFQSGVPFPMILCWYVSNSCEALIGAAATRFLLGPSARFDSMRDVTVLFLCGGLLGPFLSSFLDSAFVSLNHWGHQGYGAVWRMRFSSNVFSAFIVTPVLVTWGKNRLADLRLVSPWRWIELAAMFCSLLIISLLVFHFQLNGPDTIPILLYAPLPILLWAAVRFGTVGASTTVFLVALLAIWDSIHGRGPFAVNSPESNALSIQVLFSVISAMKMFLAASIMERRHAEERFTKAFQSGPEAMIIGRLKDGHIIEVNERCEKMFGRQRGEIIGRMVYDLDIYASSDDRGRFMRGTSIRGSLDELEICMRTKSGELRHTQISAVNNDIGGEPCFVILIRDITDRKRAEEAQQNLAHVSRLAVVGELTAMIAHEVNQPLGAILSNAEAAEIMLNTKKPPLDEIRQILADIRKDDQRADEAIRRIRTLLRKREIQLQSLDLNEAISDGLRLVAGDALRRRVQIQRDLAPGIPLVWGDRVHLQQVLLNLLINGMDAMNDAPDSERRLTIRTRYAGNAQVEVTVMDSGHGIAPEKLPRLFDSFFTTKKDGMGLGLSIARSIIEAHHGRIWAESNTGAGAIFHFTVPVDPDLTGH